MGMPDFAVLPLSEIALLTWIDSNYDFCPTGD